MDSTPVRSAQRVVEAIELAGVRYVFGIPGAKIDALFDALLDSSAEVVVWTQVLTGVACAPCSRSRDSYGGGQDLTS